MKNIVITLTLLFSLSIFSQEENNAKWESQIFINLNASNKTSYEYHDINNKPREASIKGKGFIEVEYNIDYKMLRKLSIVGTVGVANYNNLFASIKTGVGFKLLYSNDTYHYLTLQYGYQIPFSKKDFREGHQIKIGQVFDVANIFDKRLLVGFYYINDLFYLENATPILSNVLSSSSLNTSSYGISLGILF